MKALANVAILFVLAAVGGAGCSKGKDKKDGPPAAEPGAAEKAEPTPPTAAKPGEPEAAKAAEPAAAPGAKTRANTPENLAA